MMFLNIIRVLLAGWCFHFGMVNTAKVIYREGIPTRNFFNVTIPAVLFVLTFVVW